MRTGRKIFSVQEGGCRECPHPGYVTEGLDHSILNLEVFVTYSPVLNLRNFDATRVWQLHGYAVECTVWREPQWNSGGGWCCRRDMCLPVPRYNMKGLSNCLLDAASRRWSVFIELKTVRDSSIEYFRSAVSRKRWSLRIWKLTYHPFRRMISTSGVHWQHSVARQRRVWNSKLHISPYLSTSG